MQNIYVHWFLANLGFAMFFLATIIAILHKLLRWRMPTTEIVYRWYALLPVGVTCLYTYFMNVFYPVSAAAALGWLNSPFQFEVAMANLGFGLIAVLSFNASFGFRLATTIGATCWLWGQVIVHSQKVIMTHQFSITNLNPWVLLDFLLPLILLLCLVGLKKQERYR